MKCGFYMHHGAKTEPYSYIRTDFMYLCGKMSSKCNSLLICAKIVFQRAISSKMRYELWRGQNRDLCGCYMGGKRALNKVHDFRRKNRDFRWKAIPIKLFAFYETFGYVFKMLGLEKISPRQYVGP